MKNNIIATDYLIVGSGNIALHHLKAIKSYKKESKIHILKRSASIANKQLNDLCETITSKIDNFMPLSPYSVAIIASPASKHIEDATILAKKGFHLLIEKPLMISREGYQVLVNITNKNLLYSHVAYNLRFNSLLIKLKGMLDTNMYGKILDADIRVTSDFKKWRPNKNYKDTVSAQKKYGGGVVNELSHDFDYMLYLFGKPVAVTSELFLTNDKHIDVEIEASNIFRYRNYFITSYLNMCSNKEERKCIIELEKAKILLDFHKNQLSITYNKKNKIIKGNNNSFTYNKQFSYFMNCIKSKNESSMSLINNKVLFKTLESIKISHQNKKEIRV